MIGGDDSRFDRVVFNEITKKAIQAAFEEPGKLDLTESRPSRPAVSDRVVAL